MTVNGLNTSASADFLYKNDQLGFSAFSNYTKSGSIGSSGRYALYGECHGSQGCNFLVGVGEQGLYVVMLEASALVERSIGAPSLNATMMVGLVSAQLFEPPSG